MPANEIQLILEIPADEGSIEEFPRDDELPRTGFVGTSFGLDGDQFIQLGVIVSLSTVRVLRTWLTARAERLKNSRFSWEDVEFEGYSPEEVERILAILERRLRENQ